MKRFINIEDIIITDKFIPDDERNAGYNIGDLLNMPNLADYWAGNPHADPYALHRMKLLGENYKDSILDYYCSGRENDKEPVPNVNLIIKSCEQFKSKNQEILEDISVIVKQKDVCCVHIRNGDVGTEVNFIDIVIKLSRKFNKIIILSGVHLDCYFASQEHKKINFMNTINNILNQNDNMYIYLAPPDIHLSIMSIASNLLLHKGGFSCVGSIVCSGNLFVTEYFGYVNASNWNSRVNKKYTVLTGDCEYLNN